MPKHEEEESAFKVIDRRRFDEHGHERNDQEASRDEPVKKATQNPPKDAVHSEEDPLKLNFSLFIESLAHQAMMGLGIVPWPQDNIIRKDFRLAQEMIDILGILQEKTKGNLNSQEAPMLESILYQLRMAFVKLNNEPKDSPSIIK